VFRNPSRLRLVPLLTSNLPSAPHGKIYAMWVIPAGDKPVRAGLLQTESHGTAVYLRKGGVDVAATAAVAVTIEDSGWCASADLDSHHSRRHEERVAGDDPV
jgi:hypothetical protein